MYRLFAAASGITIAFVATAAPLVSDQWGALLWLAAFCGIGLLHRHQRRHMALYGMMLLVLALSPLSTSTELVPATMMLVGMAGAVSLPFVAQFVAREKDLLHLRLRVAWPTRQEWGYIAFAACMTSTVLAIYFATTSAGHNWHMETPGAALISFMAIMLIGAWEEVFFIAGVFGLLRKHLSYRSANILQAVAFTTFLYVFGFQGWVVPFVLWYTYYQGFVYYKTRNLFLTLIIHAIVDLFVFLAIFLSLRPTWAFG